MSDEWKLKVPETVVQLNRLVGCSMLINEPDNL